MTVKLVASPPRDTALPPLPTRFAGIILAFAPLFVHRSWRHASVLLLGAILTPGRRTVASVLRIMGLAHERRFVNAHRILNRAAWCPRTGSRILLGLLVEAFAPRGPVVLGLDDTIERRRGKRIAAKGIYRDPVRSSDSHFVKASGLRWMSLMLLAPIPHPACSPCSRSSPCRPRGSRPANGDASRPPRGTPNRVRPSPMPCPPCVA